jgi:hypothetical protein
MKKLKMVKYFNSLLICIIFAINGNAQPFTIDKKIKPKEIPLHTINKTNPKKGKMGIAQIAQVTDTAYYFAKGMGIYNPMVVRLVAQDTTQQIKVSLHKWNWKEASKEGVLQNGKYTESFVTEGSFGIMVVKPKGVTSIYNIYLYMAAEAPPKLPNIIKKPKAN